ncbi:type II secretion system protein [Ruficoccus sp. ZRK36]|uniref:type II secretion system protein n=1 Tax=Ruficoccus sp. ZRK36 TaxID=2866311 RepID=UPI001C73C980|nr:type II secretion system protein [Ruficoccus sp. ZRK36]QYY37459.1 type II secretion system GspH family protein [Ruficoccus sp. ZRK36]
MKRLRPDLGFSLVELLCAIAVIAILMMVVVSTLSRVKVHSQRSQSVANLKSIGQAIMLYSADHQGVLPLMCSADRWGSPIWSTNVLPEYLDNNMTEVPGDRTINSVFVDPLLEFEKHGSLGDYAANAEVLRGFPSYPGEDGLRLSKLAQADTSRLMMVMAAENGGSDLLHGMWYILPIYLRGSLFDNPRARPSTRDIGVVLGVFVDGHVAAVPEAEFAENYRDYLFLEP